MIPSVQYYLIDTDINVPAPAQEVAIIPYNNGLTTGSAIKVYNGEALVGSMSSTSAPAVRVPSSSATIVFTTGIIFLKYSTLLYFIRFINLTFISQGPKLLLLQ